MIDPSEFRRVLGHFATGVTIVTTRDSNGGPCGLTVNAFASLSLDPTLVLVCIERDSDSHNCIESTGYYAVNFLEREKGESLSRRFATWGVQDRFVGLAFSDRLTGAPVLDAALAWVDCTVTELLPVGDHTIFVGEVVAADVMDGSPLVYYRGGYGHFEP